MAKNAQELALRLSEVQAGQEKGLQKAAYQYKKKTARIQAKGERKQAGLKEKLRALGAPEDAPFLPYKKPYTIGEELISAISHGLGALLSLIALVLLLIKAVPGGFWPIFSVSVYGAALFCLYFMSMMYHSLTPRRAKAVFRVFDHCSIFLLIAGTYTPFTLLVMRDTTMGWLLFTCVWAFAVIGIVLNAVSLEKSRIFSVFAYIAMGWSVLFGIKTILERLPPAGLWLLLAGGVFYTGGVIFYALKRKYFHAVWHFFVLAGSVLHFIAVYSYLV